MPQPDITLPSWLAQREDYRPEHDKTGFMARNLLHLTSMVAHVKMGGGAAALAYGTGPVSPIDRALSHVSPALRLIGLLVCIALTLIAHNPVFLMLMGCVVLVMVALRPAAGIKATLLPSFGAAIVALVLAIPAIWVNGAVAMVSIAAKILLNVTLVLGVSWTVPWNRLISGLKLFHLPDEIIFTLDLALKHIEILGRSATRLNEALVLRSVGRTRGRFDKTTSSAGVMGATFLKAYTCGQALDEAMLCRGFTGAYVCRRERVMTPAGIIYLGGIALLVLCYLLLG